MDLTERVTTTVTFDYCIQAYTVDCVHVLEFDDVIVSVGGQERCSF